MRQGHQLGRVLIQNIWKVTAAFGVGLIAVMGGGLVLSDVHRIPHATAHGANTPYIAQKSAGTGPGDSSPRADGGVNTPDPMAPTIGTAPDPQVPASTSLAPVIGRKNAKRKREFKPLTKTGESRTDSSPLIAAAPAGPAFPLTPMLGPGIAQVASGTSSSGDAALTVAAETPVTIRLTQQLSTKQNHKGEAFHGTLAVPLTASGVVIARAGAPVTGRIVDARSPRFFRGGSTLNLELTQVEAINGRPLAVKTAQWYATGSHSRVVKAAILPGDAAKKVISGMKAGEENANGPEQNAVEESDSNEKSEKKRTGVTLSSGSEIEFRLVQSVTVSGSLDRR